MLAYNTDTNTRAHNDKRMLKQIAEVCALILDIWERTGSWNGCEHQGAGESGYMNVTFRQSVAPFTLETQTWLTGELKLLAAVYRSGTAVETPLTICRNS